MGRNLIWVCLPPCILVSRAKVGYAGCRIKHFWYAKVSKLRPKERPHHMYLVEYFCNQGHCYRHHISSRIFL